MAIPLQIVFHHMKSSEALEAKVRRRVEALERLGVHILSCRITIEQEKRRHQNGNLFRARIDLRVPGKDIVASHAPSDAACEDAYVALRDAFDSAERQLKEYLSVRRGEIKHHEPRSMQ